MTVEETNAHAWDRQPKENEKPEQRDEKEKSIIAAPPSTDGISFDFSVRGASLMCTEANKSTNKSRTEEIMNDEVEEASTTVNNNSINNESVSVIPNESRNESKMDETVVIQKEKENTPPSVTTTDFSAFNSFIAKERRESVAAAADKSSTNMEEDGRKLTSSVPDEILGKSRRSSFFERSRFSFDFSDALEGWKSPAAATTTSSQGSNRRSSMRRSRASLPFDVLFTEALQKAVNQHCPDDEDVFDYDDGEKPQVYFELSHIPHLDF